MSFRILVVTEDFRRDQFIARPVVERMAAECRPRALVEVCRRPKLGGVRRGFDEAYLRRAVLPLYPMFDVIVLLLDRDGVSGRQRSLVDLAERLTTPSQRVLGAAAIEELEIFVLAGHPHARNWDWQAMRRDADVKNTHFRRLVAETGCSTLPFEGRASLMAEALRHWSRIKALCPKDIGSLLAQLRRAASTGAGA